MTVIIYSFLGSLRPTSNFPQKKFQSTTSGIWRALAGCLVLMAYGVFAPRISQAAPPDASYELALSQFRSGKYREATATLRGALEQYPQNAQFELLLARCYYEMGDLNRATEHAESAADIDPSSSEAHLWLGQVYGRQAEQSHSLILASKTRKEFEKAVELAPHNIEARRDLMEFYLQAPWLLGGSRDKARKQVDAIAALDSLEGALARARFDELVDQPAEAAAEYQQVLAMKPDCLGPYMEAADFYLRQRNVAGMKEVISAALKVNAADLRLDYYRGVAHVLQGNHFVEAERELRAYVNHGPFRSDFPSPASALSWLGRLYEQWGRPQLAVAQYQAALQLNPHLGGAREALQRLKKP